MSSCQVNFWLTANSENGLDDPGFLDIHKRQNFFVGKVFEELNRDINEILAFPVLPLVVSKFANEKARRNIFWGVYLVFKS